MVSFDVKSLFTNVPLERTINIILKKIYVEKLIITDIKEKELKGLLMLCTKQVHFSFNNEFYIQQDGVAIGSPLGPVIANMFMSELENSIVPQLGDCIIGWKRYVDDTFAFIDPDKLEEINDILNSFDNNISFTHELEQNNQLPFLDALISNNNGDIQSTVYRKPTNTDVYINWNAHAPKIWKNGTILRGLYP